MLRSADSLIASMRIKEALAVIDNYGLSALESRELASTKLNEPPYNLKTRYEIKAKVIQQKRSVYCNGCEQHIQNREWTVPTVEQITGKEENYPAMLWRNTV